jgi:hypothetical protein
MKVDKTNKILFLILIILASLSIVYLFFILIKDYNYLISELFFSLTVVISILSSTIALFFIHKMLKIEKKIKKENQEKQRCIRAYYQYQKLFDPIELDN